MIYITDLSGVFSGGKVNPDAKEVISKLKGDDRLVILSDDGNLVMNTETLILFTGMGEKIAIEKCVSPIMAVFVIGKYAGSGDLVRVISKNTELIKSLDFLKGSESVLFGWKSASKKKAGAAKKAKAPKKEKNNAAADDSFMSFEESPNCKEEAVSSGKPEKESSKKSVDSSDFLDLPVESVLGMDPEYFHKAGIRQVKDLYVYSRSRKKWSAFLTKAGYDEMVTKLKAFGQPSLKEYN